MNSIIPYDEDDLNGYKSVLAFFLSLSNLFSTNNTPFIHYRLTENIYCEYLRAQNISRKDLTIDAKKGDYGIAIKTFIQNKTTKKFEKIAEFNKQRKFYVNLTSKNLALKISELRNIRIEFVKREYSLHKLLYHLITRKNKSAHIFEKSIDLIDLSKIKVINENTQSITFSDDHNIYRFVKSKSTLFQEFDLVNPIDSINVEIIRNPMATLKKYIESIGVNKESSKTSKNIEHAYDSISVPLFSYKKGKPHVYTKSGLNQWNASGRKRDINEVYIPYPSNIRLKKPNFFPKRDTEWKLLLPNGNMLSMKVCQENDKALMSNPNKALGEWLLRNLLNLKEGELLTYDKLLEIGITKLEFIKKLDNYELLLT